MDTVYMQMSNAELAEAIDYAFSKVKSLSGKSLNRKKMLLEHIGKLLEIQVKRAAMVEIEENWRDESYGLARYTEETRA